MILTYLGMFMLWYFHFQFVGAMLVQMFAANPYIDSQPQPQVLNYHMNTDNMPNSYNFQ